MRHDTKRKHNNVDIIVFSTISGARKGVFLSGVGRVEGRRSKLRRARLWRVGSSVRKRRENGVLTRARIGSFFLLESIHWGHGEIPVLECPVTFGFRLGVARHRFPHIPRDTTTTTVVHIYSQETESDAYFLLAGLFDSFLVAHLLGDCPRPTALPRSARRGPFDGVRPEIPTQQLKMPANRNMADHAQKRCRASASAHIHRDGGGHRLGLDWRPRICILILVRRAIRLRPDDPLETRQTLRGNAAATPRMKNSKMLWNYIRIVIKASLFFLEGLAYTNGPEVVF